MPASDERKPVTVLFGDLVGSTELATRHDPESLRALLSAFFDEMRQQIETYGGTVEKYAGDAVMAVFGVPQVHEDDAERGVRAAVAMRDALAELNPMFEQEYGVRLTLRIGVATGEVVAASGAVSEFMVTGEVPNLEVGRLTEARRVIDRAAEHGQANRSSTPFALTYITIAAALARLAAGEADAALETARRALGFADRSRFRLEQGAAHRVLGQAYAATGHRAEADAAFRGSIEILKAIRSWPELGQTLLAYGQFQLATDPAQGHASIERARAIFDEIGATGWLAEAEAALGAR